jgi:nucleoside-diphosphate-sugar epimerase
LPSDEVLTVITGAAGFIGRIVAARLSKLGDVGQVRLVDRIVPPAHAKFACLQADLTDRDQLAKVLDGADRVIHLAALPGGASEANPNASREINLDAALNLMDTLGSSGRRPRLVYASSIAVFGTPFPEMIDDNSVPRPAMVYGTHKLMIECALADALRRRTLNGIALRLPGIIARPYGAGGFKSAFASDIVHAIRNGEPYEVPVDEGATMWLLSSACCADALIHASVMILPESAPPAVTLPALRVTMQEFVAAIGVAAERAISGIIYRPDAKLTAQFGRMPVLVTRVAESLGFKHDGDIHRLAASALSGL